MNDKEKSISDLISKSISEYSNKLNEIMYSDYRSHIKGLFLQKILYKGYDFIVTDAKIRTVEDYPTLNENGESFILEQVVKYEWVITLSLSLVNKIELSLNEYNDLLIGNQESHNLLDLAIQKELKIKEGLMNIEKE